MSQRLCSAAQLAWRVWCRAMLVLVLWLQLCWLSACAVHVPIRPDMGFYAIWEHVETASGLRLSLQWQPGSTALPNGYDPPISLVRLDVTYELDSIVRLRVTDPAGPRWEVPGVAPPPAPTASIGRAYRVDLSPNKQQFSLRVTRTADGAALFDSTYLFYSKRYLQLGTRLPADSNIYGLGERVTSWRKSAEVNNPYDSPPVPNSTYSFIASDQPTPYSLPLYGSHPFWLNILDGGLSCGAFLLSSNSLDINLEDYQLTYLVTGGILDLWLFAGPSPQAVLAQYALVIGRPMLPPYWALGYQQCRAGYHNVSDLQAVVEMFEHLAVPVEAFCVDLDYMNESKIWTLGEGWAELGRLVDGLHAKNVRFVPVVHPGVALDPGYEVYLQGLANNVFVLDPTRAAPYIGKAWSGRVHFVDWTHPNASSFLTHWLANFSAQVRIDGLWADMNEVSSFCDGRCYVGPAEQDSSVVDGSLFHCNCTHQDRFDTGYYDEPPYMPLMQQYRKCRSIQGDISGLDIGTMSMANSWHAGLEYDLHNLHGWLETNVTAAALRTLTKRRPFVLSRSTFAGSGRHAAHWLGDNRADWGSLEQSIASILDFGLFQVPLVGASVCGFGGNTTAELCTRWLQLATFYPLMRNHNARNALAQEPYAFGEPALSSNIKSLRLRYSLLPYLYTAFYRARLNGGGVVESLVARFPQDPDTPRLALQFMFGPALLVTPVVAEGSLTVYAYFPMREEWYDFYTGQRVVCSTAGERTLSLSAPLESINVHVQGGNIIPLQTPGLNSAQQRANPYQLLVALAPPAVGRNCTKCASYQPNLSAFKAGGSCTKCLAVESPVSCQSCCQDLLNLSDPCLPLWLESFGLNGGILFANAMQSAALLCGITFETDCASSVLSKGQLFLDDGQSLDTVENGLFSLLSLQATVLGSSDIVLRTQLLASAFPASNIIDSITLFGVDHICASDCVSVRYGDFSQVVRQNGGFASTEIRGLPYLPLLSNAEIFFTCEAVCPPAPFVHTWYEGVIAGLGFGGCFLAVGWWMHRRHLTRRQLHISVASRFEGTDPRLLSIDHKSDNRFEGPRVVSTGQLSDSSRGTIDLQ
eukprot:g1720.t1